MRPSPRVRRISVISPDRFALPEAMIAPSGRPAIRSNEYSLKVALLDHASERIGNAKITKGLNIDRTHTCGEFQAAGVLIEGNITRQRCLALFQRQLIDLNLGLEIADVPASVSNKTSIDRQVV